MCLQLLLCGSGEYSVADLRQHHTLAGGGLLGDFALSMQRFWTIVSGFTNDDMAR